MARLDSRWPKRSDSQIRGGKSKNVKGNVRKGKLRKLVTIKESTNIKEDIIRKISKIRGKLIFHSFLESQVKRNDPNTKTPSMSPAHQASQVVTRIFVLITPPKN